MKTSYREAMALIHANTPVPKFRSGFHWAPNSMRALFEACDPPGIEKSYVASETEYDNQDWTEECQGIAFDSGYWYISSNGSGGRRGIYKFDSSFTPGFSFNMDGYGDHLGDIDVFNGRIYAPIEPTLEVVWLDTTPFVLGKDTLKSHEGGSPPQINFPWCAIHPGNGLLYSSNFYNVSHLYAYDPARNFRHVATLDLEIAIDSVQGGCFSPHGHVYLTSGSSNDIRAFTSLNGAFLGSTGIEVSSLTGEEVEGMCFAPMLFNGIQAPLHVVLLDNDITNPDDVILKHYTLPNAN